MRQNASNNGQDILNWFKTDELEFEFTEKGYPIIEPITKEEIRRQHGAFSYAPDMAFKRFTGASACA